MKSNLKDEQENRTVIWSPISRTQADGTKQRMFSLN
jgi:hypothetical protein